MKRAWYARARYAWGIDYVEDSSDPVLVDESDSYKGTCQVCTFRYLLFETRSEAREWCAEKNTFSHLPPTKRPWYFRPVKVRETIEIIGR